MQEVYNLGYSINQDEYQEIEFKQLPRKIINKSDFVDDYSQTKKSISKNKNYIQCSMSQLFLNQYFDQELECPIPQLFLIQPFAKTPYFIQINQDYVPDNFTCQNDKCQVFISSFIVNENLDKQILCPFCLEGLKNQSEIIEVFNNPSKVVYNYDLIQKAEKQQTANTCYMVFAIEINEFSVGLITSLIQQIYQGLENLARSNYKIKQKMKLVLFNNKIVHFGNSQPVKIVVQTDLMDDSDLIQFEQLLTNENSFVDIGDQGRLKEYLQQIIDQCYCLFDENKVGNCLNSLIKQFCNIKDNQNYFRLFCFPSSQILYGQMIQIIDISKIQKLSSIKDKMTREYVNCQKQFYRKLLDIVDRQKTKLRLDLFILKENSVQIYLMKELVDNLKGFIKQYSNISENQYEFAQLMIDIPKIINQKVFYDLDFQLNFNDIFQMKQMQEQCGIVEIVNNKNNFKIPRFNQLDNFFVKVQEQYMDEKILRMFVQVVVKFYDQYQNQNKTRILNQTMKVNTNRHHVYQHMNDSVITKYYMNKLIKTLFDSQFDKQFVNEQSLFNVIKFIQDYRSKKGYSTYQNLVFPESIDTVPLNMHSLSKKECLDMKAEFNLNSIISSAMDLKRTELHRLEFVLYPCLFELTQKKKQQKHFSSQQYNKIVSQHLFYRIQLKQLKSSTLNVWNNKVYLIFNGYQLIILEGDIDDPQIKDEYIQFKQKLQSNQINVRQSFNKNFMGIENIFRLVLEIYSIEQLVVDQVVFTCLGSQIQDDRNLMSCFVEDKTNYLMSYSQYLVNLHSLLN